MPILNEYGNPVASNRRFVDAAMRNDGSRPWMPVNLADIETLVPATDWRTIIAVSRKLYTNFGIVKGAINQKAAYSVGKAWNPVFKGEDRDWGRKASQLLRDEWYNNCDIRGSGFTFKKNLRLDSVALDRDGDYFVVLLDNPYPMTQRIPAHRVGSRYYDDFVTPGPGKNRNRYVGLMNIKGVIVNTLHRPIAYQVLGDEEENDHYIPADRMIHVFDPDWHEATRGLPIFIHGLNDLRDSLQSHQWEQLSQLALSSISMVEYNDRGGPDDDDTRTELLGGTSEEDSAMAVTSMLGGLIRYFKSNSGGKLEQVKQDRPGDVWESFQDRIVRGTLTGANWPYSMVWKTNDLTSVTQRAEINKAKVSVEDRQELMKTPCRRVVGWAVSKFIKLGRLDPNPEWWNWDFIMPPDISIDPGRDSKDMVSSYQLGAINMTGIVSARHGRGLEEHYLERADEIILKKKIADEKSTESGYEVTSEELGHIPNTPIEQNSKKEEPKKEDEITENS